MNGELKRWWSGGTRHTVILYLLPLIFLRRRRRGVFIYSEYGEEIQLSETPSRLQLLLKRSSFRPNCLNSLIYLYSPTIQSASAKGNGEKTAQNFHRLLELGRKEAGVRVEGFLSPSDSHWSRWSGENDWFEMKWMDFSGISLFLIPPCNISTHHKHNFVLKWTDRDGDRRRCFPWETSACRSVGG